MMLSGHGADNGIIVGSNCCGIPKKRADHIELNRIGGNITAKVVRHGVTLIECEVNLGRYNVAAAARILGDREAGEENTGSSFFNTFNMLQTENGNTVFSDVNLVQLFSRSKCLSWEQGELSSITMRSSEDDPFGEFQVMQPLGAAYLRNEYVEMTKTVKLAELDPDVTMPYLMTGRYDRSMMGHYSTYLTGFYNV
jgi:acetoacetate decarboxylase